MYQPYEGGSPPAIGLPDKWGTYQIQESDGKEFPVSGNVTNLRCG